MFLDCIMDESIAPERFSGWGGITKDEPNTFYGEYGTRIVSDLQAGADAQNATDSSKVVSLDHKNHWVRNIDEAAAEEISRLADDVVRICTRILSDF